MNPTDGSLLPDLVRSLAGVLDARGWKLAVAESCTGGGLGAALTDLAGSSSFFLGGVIAYDNRIKARWLDVPEAVLRGEGAVSRDVAERMADGCRRRLAADLAVAITGIAGPGGATPTKPVGLVFIAVSTSSGTRAVEHRFPGGRADVRRAAVAAALRLAIEAAS
jgi:PncC family amidohydrolase